MTVSSEISDLLLALSLKTKKKRRSSKTLEKILDLTIIFRRKLTWLYFGIAHKEMVPFGTKQGSLNNYNARVLCCKSNDCRGQCLAVAH